MKKFALGLIGFGSLVTGSAFAAVPAGVTTALSEMSSDGVTVAGAVLAAVVAIFAIKLIRRAL